MADPNPSRPPPPTPERKRASPLLWILLLLALLAFGWFIYSQRTGVTTAPEPLPPAPVDIGDGQDAPAERERAADDARREARARQEREAAAGAARTAGPDRDATPLTRVEPEYPLEAYRRREEGTVLLGVDIDSSGKPVDVRVLRRSGSRDLDQAALEAVRQWTFEPAVRNGKAVASEAQVPVTFRFDR